MSRLMRVALSAATVGVALASAASAQPKAATNPQDLVNLEAQWSKAIVARDSATISKIVAADWHGQNEKGKLVDRAAMVRETVSGPTKLSSMTNHDVHVRFMGPDHAVVQGMDDETGITKGKAVHRVYSWTDVFEKRNGLWVAIASQNTPVK